MSTGALLRLLGTLALISLLAGCGSTEHAASTHASSTGQNKKIKEHVLSEGPEYDYKTHAEVVVAVHKAVAECKAAVLESNQVSASEKNELKEACSEGYTRHEPFEVYSVSKSVCTELALLVRDESKQAKERAFAACYTRAKRWK
ncbi:MAG TPA: hypothetical protein VMB05_01755 [Solirubrobacteraceae bacterium]|nr:hypothetical protein [Solirubrobacteraceae bacterium]